MDDGGKCTVLSFTELMQSVGVHNLRHNWESALESYPWAAHCVLPVPTEKTSDKVTLPRTQSSVHILYLDLLLSQVLE